MLVSKVCFMYTSLYLPAAESPSSATRQSRSPPTIYTANDLAERNLPSAFHIMATQSPPERGHSIPETVMQQSILQKAELVIAS